MWTRCLREFKIPFFFRAEIKLHHCAPSWIPRSAINEIFLQQLGPEILQLALIASRNSMLSIGAELSWFYVSFFSFSFIELPSGGTCWVSYFAYRRARASSTWREVYLVFLESQLDFVGKIIKRGPGEAPWASITIFVEFKRALSLISILGFGSGVTDDRFILTGCFKDWRLPRWYFELVSIMKISSFLNKIFRGVTLYRLLYFVL